MEEKNIEDSVLVVKQCYEKMLADKEAEYKLQINSLEKKLKEQEEKHINELKALLTGRTEIKEMEEKTEEQQLYDDLYKKFIKKES